MNSAFCVWFYGLSGAGKTTLANALAKALKEQGIPVVQLDGDDFRKGVSKDLGFTQNDRAENIRRAAEMTKLLLDQGTAVIASFMTPQSSDQSLVRDRLTGQRLQMVYVDTPLDVCIQRDSKSVYAKRRQFVYGEDLDFEARIFDLRLDGASPISQNLTKIIACLPIDDV